jgi:hypothetical protein
MPEMNDFKLEIQSGQFPHWTENCFLTMIHVDGIKTFPERDRECIDLLSVVDSLYKPGRYDLFTCSCGDPGCAGWNNDIVVDHDELDAIWSHHSPNPRFPSKRFSRLQMHTELLRELEQVVPQLRIITEIHTSEGSTSTCMPNIDHEQSDIGQIANCLHRLHNERIQQ